jgi:hypothetical protein
MRRVTSLLFLASCPLGADIAIAQSGTTDPAAMRQNVGKAACNATNVNVLA